MEDKNCRITDGIKVCEKKVISMKEIRNPSNYTVWQGYIETPVSFDPLGSRWLFNLEGASGRPLVANQKNMRDAIRDNEDYIAELLEEEGYEIRD